MDINKIQESLKTLPPSQKLELLQSSLEKEKNKKNKKLLLYLIEKAKQEKSILEESISRLQKTDTKKEETEEPLETLVEEAAQMQSKEQGAKSFRIYGANEQKPEELYGVEKLGAKYLTPELRKNKEYRSEPVHPHSDRFTLQEEQRLINSESHRLEKEKKKYQTGVS